MICFIQCFLPKFLNPEHEFRFLALLVGISHAFRQVTSQPAAALELPVVAKFIVVSSTYILSCLPKLHLQINLRIQHDKGNFWCLHPWAQARVYIFLIDSCSAPFAVSAEVIWPWQLHATHLVCAHAASTQRAYMLCIDEDVWLCFAWKLSGAFIFGKVP